MGLAAKLLDVLSAEYSRFRPDIIDFKIKVETDEGAEEVWPFAYHPEDGSPITLGVKLWLEAHPDFKVAKAAPLTPADFHLNRRDVRTVFLTLGFPADAVDIAIQNRPAGGEREEAMLSWLEDDYFQRDSAVVLIAFEHWRGIDPNLTAEQVNERWILLGKRTLTGERAVPVSEAVVH